MFLSQLSEPLARAAGIKGSAFRVHRAQESGAKGIVKFFQRHCINPFESTYKHSLPRKESCTQECNQNKKKQKIFQAKEGSRGHPSQKRDIIQGKGPIYVQVQVETGINVKQTGKRKHPASSFRSFRSASRAFKKESRKKESILYPSSKVPGARTAYLKRNQEKKKASCTHHQRSQEREQGIQKGIRKKRKHPAPVIKSPKEARRISEQKRGQANKEDEERTNDMAERIVIALGGNALQAKGRAPTAENQLEVVRRTAEQIAEVSRRGYEMAIVHGNGPQVGQILQAGEAARETVPPMPFDVCGAMSQGYIGYHIQQALRYALSVRGRNIPVVSLTTQVVVDRRDPAFGNPTKPIGSFYTAEEAQQLAQEKGYLMKEDAGRGWRRVVASPRPQKIVEIGSIRLLWDQTIVITCGGGGIPVAENADGTLEGIAAVIDKDYAAELLAEEVNADALLILTEVEKAAIRYNQPDQQDLDHLSLSEAARYVEEGHFGAGSMQPKIEAAMRFARNNPGRRAIITSLDKCLEALEGKTGTVVTFS